MPGFWSDPHGDVDSDRGDAVVLPALELGRSPGFRWERWAEWVVLGSVGLGAMRFCTGAVGAYVVLRKRKPVRDTRLLRALVRAGRRGTLGVVRLTECAGVPSACAIGTREICVGRGVLDELTPEELEAIFSHELAHFERRDGLWFPIARFFEQVLWLVQPSGGFIAAQLRASAEFSCDERAVARCGRPRALARAIVRVGERIAACQAERFLPSLRGRGVARGRVRRLVSAGPLGPRRPMLRAGWSSGLVLGGFVAISAFRVHSTGATTGGGMLDETLARLSAQALNLDDRAARIESELLGLDGNAALTEPARLELEQSLRHTREDRTFIEQRLSTGD